MEKIATHKLVSLPPACRCGGAGVANSGCSPSGQCVCLHNYGGQECDTCAPGFYGYPDCAGKWIWLFMSTNATTIDTQIRCL